MASLRFLSLIIIRLIDQVHSWLLALNLLLHLFISLHIVIAFIALILQEHCVEGLLLLGVDDCAGDF